MAGRPAVGPYLLQYLGTASGFGAQPQLSMLPM